MRKYGAPAESNIRNIVAEDIQEPDEDIEFGDYGTDLEDEDDEIIEDEE